MPTTIPQRELRNNNAEVMDRVAHGESFIVTRNGAPVAELRPFTGTQRRMVPTAELVAAQLPRIDSKQFLADRDASIDPYVSL